MTRNIKRGVRGPLLCAAACALLATACKPPVKPPAIAKPKKPPAKLVLLLTMGPSMPMRTNTRVSICVESPLDNNAKFCLAKNALIKGHRQVFTWPPDVKQAKRVELYYKVLPNFHRCPKVESENLNFPNPIHAPDGMSWLQVPLTCRTERWDTGLEAEAPATAPTPTLIAFPGK